MAANQHAWRFFKEIQAARAHFFLKIFNQSSLKLDFQTQLFFPYNIYYELLQMRNQWPINFYFIHFLLEFSMEFFCLMIPFLFWVSPYYILPLRCDDFPEIINVTKICVLIICSVVFQVVKREIISRDMDLTSSYLCPEQPPPLIPDSDKGELLIQIPLKRKPSPK